MPRGRPPKPTTLKILSGNPGKRPLNDAEPLPPRGVPVCPDWLDDAAQAKWTALAPQLDRLGLLTVIDGDVLAGYCIAWSELRQATQTLAKEGRYTTRGTGGLALHPAVAQQRTALRAVKDFAALFGLDPSSRSRLKVSSQDEVDELGAFLGAK